MAWIRKKSAVLAGAVAVACGVSVASAGAVTAATPMDPIIASGQLLASPQSADGSRIAGYDIKDDRNLELQVYSAAMGKNIEVDVQRPNDASAPRPTLYLLAGAGGGEDKATWEAQTDVPQFLAGQDVNLIQPVGGKFSYYTDWIKDDPELGANKWKTFFTEELPPLVDAALGTNGANAIAGLSMSGTSVLQLAEAKPGLFKSVAAYSGAAQISDPVGYDFVSTVVRAGGGNPDNMYGPKGDPMWAENDPLLHAERLRGTDLFISSGSGLPGPWDTLDGEHALPGPGGLANQVTLGGALEGATNWGSHNLQNRLNELGIPATYDFTPVGTHSWGYWEDSFMKSWPVLARGMGLSA
ncbi:alpha/beta hydrolase family protein [Nocardia sp. XZ_19_385]|uniref:alpha/beta hydrolase n=1 Tax=Nocardia sp. XZ_19_385 TaxID=2769488 RepID=UPI00188E3231|nr:alpha/beta hydrolase family protein [Nocardia sp. XZ_19_385]